MAARIDLARVARTAKKVMTWFGIVDLVVGAYAFETAREGRFDLRERPELIGVTILCALGAATLVSAAVFVAAKRAEARRLQRETVFD